MSMSAADGPIQHRMTISLTTTDHLHHDCASVVRHPVDAPPMRSPQAVHSLLARRFSGSNVVEIGTRNGDGVACWAKFAKHVTAIENDRQYCDVLQARGNGSFAVHCADFEKSFGVLSEAEYVTWWMGGENNKGLLTTLQARAPRLRPHARAAIIFDQRYSSDVDSWSALRPMADWWTTVDFDECDRCLAKQNLTDFVKQKRASYLYKFQSCDRALGTFVVASFRLRGGALNASSLPDVGAAKLWKSNFTHGCGAVHPELLQPGRRHRR